MRDRPAPASHVIVTADDFGLDPAINEAVEEAFKYGTLTAASLMVGEAAAGDAVARARRLPGLRVGLHVALTGGARPVLPPARVSELVGPGGRFSTRLAAFGMKLASSRSARRQACAEIRAQFEAFAAAGLELDHANAHQHFHLHPFVLDAILQVGREFGLKAVRLPYEPLWLAAKATAALPRVGRIEAAAWALGARRMQHALRADGLICNDYVFGLRCSGRLDQAKMSMALRDLPPGIVELYLHPATRVGSAECAAGVGPRATEEFAALMSPGVRAQLLAVNGTVGGYRDIPGAALAPAVVCAT